MNRWMVLVLCLGFTLTSRAEEILLPLFPAGEENGAFLYESPPLTRTGNAGVQITGTDMLRDWDITLMMPTDPEAALPETIRCQVQYIGSLPLTARRQEACRPAVLLMPARGLRFETQQPSVSWLGSLLGYTAPERAHADDDTPQNVLFLMIDTLRADHTPPYGHPFIQAPHIEMLASLGATFTRSYGASSSTRPSVGSIFSGMHPLSHGAERHALNGARLHESIHTLPEWFLERGYQTSGVSSNAQITTAFGFDQGFINYQCPVGEHRVTPLGIRQLRQLSEPFFLYLHYLAPHAPYDPPAPWRGMYEGMTPYPEQDAHCAEISLDDHRVGEILAELARQGLLQRTLIWLFSDHGEEFWEHGWNGHGAKLYEESVQTVSIMMDPKRIRPGKRIELPTIHMDVFPTLLEWFGETPKPHHQGISMLDWITGTPDGFDRALFLHHGGGLEDAAHPSDKQAMLKDNRKLIWWTESDEWEWYNLETDPGEQNNLADSDDPAIDEYRDSLKQNVETFRELGLYHESLSAEQDIQLSSEELQNLRDLGYIQ